MGLVVSAGAAASPLVDIPDRFAAQISQPCVIYSCPGSPEVHSNWLKTVGNLPLTYCQQFTCSPMDLIADNGVDDNLFPLNPDWAYFTETGQRPDAQQLCQNFTKLDPPPCTSQPVALDQPGSLTAAFYACKLGRDPTDLGFRGHINWEPGTYEGTLQTFGHSNSWYDDGRRRWPARRTPGRCSRATGATRATAASDTIRCRAAR